jgi:hypothetical protein
MASARLTKTTSSSTGKIFTISVWLKKADNAANSMIFHLTSDSNTNKYVEVASKSGYAIDFQLRNGTSGDNGTYLRRRLTRLFRDVNGWYHLVIRFDSTNSTAADRARIYVNGEQATDVDQDSTPDVPLNFVSDLNNANSNLSLAGSVGGSNYLNGQLAHFHFTDGYSYAPTEFGETDATTGIWKPKTSPSVTYGTNGFFLKFDNSGNMGLDSSGQGNNFTTNGTIIQNKDTPSNVFCTMNPLMINPSATNTFANTNNTVTINATDACVGATLGASSGKYYWEQKWTQQGANDRWGVCPDDAAMTAHPRTTGIGWDTATSQFYLLGSAVSGSWGGSIGTSEIIQIALDLDNGALYLGVNGTYRNSGNPTSGSSRTGAVNFSSSSLVGKYLLPAFGKGNQDNSTMQYNFGNGYFGTTAVSSAQNPDDGIGIFEYDVPAGYRALCTKSINAEEYS